MLALINSLSAGRDQVRGYASFQKTITAFHKFSILAFDAEAAESSTNSKPHIRVPGLWI
jgi:hypothetical protein